MNKDLPFPAKSSDGTDPLETTTITKSSHTGDFPRFSFITIVLNGMPFIEHAIKAVYDFAHEIIIVEGAVENCMFAANPDGSSTDGTVELIQRFPDPHNRIRLIQGRWPEKVHMQNKALEYVTGDYVWLVDSDEIYKQEDLTKIKNLIQSDPSITQINFIPDNFWKDFDHIFVSPLFFESGHHYRRVFKFVSGARFTSHRPPTMIYPGAHLTTEQMRLIDGSQTRKLDIIPFHYSYVLDEQVKQKIELYNRYGWGKGWGLDLNEWYRECFLKWTPENREAVESQYPVWTGDRNSYSKLFSGTHPTVMSDFIETFRSGALPQEEAISEAESLPLIGAAFYQQKVLEAWNYIELDEPLEGRRRKITQNIGEGKPFWNNHVALAFIAHTLQPQSYLEIGVRTGGSLVQVLNNSDVREVVALDLWSGNYAGLKNTVDFAVKQIENLQQKTGRQFNVEFVPGNSHVTLKTLINNNRKFDLITIDGDHTEAGAWEDIKDCIELLNESGVMVFDDIIHPEHGYLLDLANRLKNEHPDFTLLLNTQQDNGCAIFLKNVDFSTLKSSATEAWRKQQVKIAGAKPTSEDLSQIDLSSDFARTIGQLFAQIRPKKIIETGTYLGTGTTTIIASAIRQLGIQDAAFYSIEVNPVHHHHALRNLSQYGIANYVKALNGLSVPRHLLPTLPEIEETYVNNIEFDNIYVDHQKQDRAHLYFNETNFENVPADLLGACLKEFNYHPDFVLLDSGGHIGNIEFNYLINQLKGECYIALDDVGHVKHHKSFLQIQGDPRFELLISSQEKFGFCIAKFTPQSESVSTDVDRILWVRTDSIGDNVLAASMLPHIREKYKAAKIIAVCQEHIAELYEACPFVDEIVRFDRMRVYQDEGYRNDMLQRLRTLNADIALNSVYSREPLTDLFAVESRAKERFALTGNLSNISEGVRDKHNQFYTQILPSASGHKLELERHRDFLKGLGINASSLEPMIWTMPEDEQFADAFFRSNDLQPEKTIVLFAGAQYQERLYAQYGAALSQICQVERSEIPHGGANQFAVVALGVTQDHQINQQNLDSIGVRTVNCSGQTTIRQTAAILKRCRLAVGAETAAAHVASAVGTPNVILLGGGAFWAIHAVFAADINRLLTPGMLWV